MNSDIYDYYVNGIISKTSHGIPSIRQTGGISFSSSISSEELASYGWLKRESFVVPNGYVVVNESKTLTPDYVNKISIESYDIITEEESEAARQATKSEVLKMDENNFLDFCELLGFSGKASTAEIESILISMSQEALLANDLAEYAQANLLAHSAHSLIHEVEIHNGTWFDIPNTKHILT